MAVTDSPPKMPIFNDEESLPPILPDWSVVLPFTRKVKVKTMRAIHCTMAPSTNAMATDRKMPRITEMAFSVLSKSPNVSRTPLSVVAPPDICIKAMAKAPPSNSKTMLTVVEVGIPSVLNTSSSTTSVTITAKKTHITS